MDKKQWDSIKHFGPEENWGDPNLMDYCLLKTLDALREYIDKPIHIHCGYEARGNSSQHCKGRAVDCHCEELDLFDFFIAASRFNFGGIGVYPWWNNPGLHLDTREISKYGYRALCGSVGPKQYVPLTRQIFGGGYGGDSPHRNK